MLALCVGQAGCQIGGSLASRTGPLSGCGSARRSAGTGGVSPGGFVFVDSEPKAVRALLEPSSADALPWLSVPGGVVWDDAGRGNNWAWGYSGRGPGFGAHGTGLAERAMAAVRRQAEACDVSLAGPRASVVVLHSLGGGTGAGLGSRLIDALREEFPRCEACGGSARRRAAAAQTALPAAATYALPPRALAHPPCPPPAADSRSSPPAWRPSPPAIRRCSTSTPR